VTDADCGPVAGERRMDEWRWSVANRKRPLLEVMKAYFVAEQPLFSAVPVFGVLAAVKFLATEL
jgi:hypothetical protein